MAAIKRATARVEARPAWDPDIPKMADAIEDRPDLGALIAYELGCKFTAVAWTSEDVPTGAGNLSDEETRQALAAANAHVSEGSAAMYAAFFETLGIRPPRELWTADNLDNHAPGAQFWTPRQRRLCCVAASDLAARGHAEDVCLDGCLDAAGIDNEEFIHWQADLAKRGGER